MTISQSDYELFVSMIQIKDCKYKLIKNKITSKVVDLELGEDEEVIFEVWRITRRVSRVGK